MSNPASFVITRTKVYWSKTSNNHSEISQEYDLYVHGARSANVVFVELVPTDGNYDSDPNTWSFCTCQPDHPEWYDSPEVRARILIVLPEWKQFHYCFQGEDKSLLNLLGGDGVVQRSGDDSVEHAGDHAVQISRDHSTQIAKANAVQTGGFRVSQRAGFRAVQTAGDNSLQQAGQRSVQHAGHESVQFSYTEASQHAGRASTQSAGGASMQTAGDNSTQRAGVNSVQITRWCDPYWHVADHWHIAARVVTEVMAGQWWFVSEGIWRPCTPDEARAADARINQVI